MSTKSLANFIFWVGCFLGSDKLFYGPHRRREKCICTTSGKMETRATPEDFNVKESSNGGQFGTSYHVHFCYLFQEVGYKDCGSVEYIF